MRLTLAFGVICILISGCRDGATGTSTGKNNAVADAATFVVVDRRDPNVDHVAIISGSHAFAQLKPFRSEAPPSGRRETAQFPRDQLLALQKAAATKGLEPPFVPGGAAMLIGTVTLSGSDVSWRYFEGDNEDVVACLDDLRAAIQSVGTPTDDVPTWIVNDEIRKLLEGE